MSLSPALKRRFFIVSGIITIVFISCLLAPWIKRLMTAAAYYYPLFEHIAESPLHRILARIIIVMIILFLVVFNRRIFHDSGSFSAIKPVEKDGTFFVLGLMLGITSLVIQVAFAILSGGRHFYFTAFSWSKLPVKLFSDLFSACVIGFCEEFFFRGVIFRHLKRHFPLIVALIVSSLIYSTTHFFQPKELAGIDETSALSGFIVLFKMLTPFISSDFIPESIGLFLVGLCLATGYHYTRSLYFAIGLHAGWVFVIKFDGMIITRCVPDQIRWWGASNLVGGVGTWILLVLILICIKWIIAPRISRKTEIRST